jgi:hypothetical protein
MNLKVNLKIEEELRIKTNNVLRENTFSIIRGELVSNCIGFYFI